MEGFRILYPLFVIAAFPYVYGAFQAEGETAFQVLHGFFQGDILGWRQQKMDVVGHDDEGMDRHAVLCALVSHYGEEEFGGAVGLEDAASLCGDEGEEESPDFLRRERHERKDSKARG